MRRAQASYHLHNLRRTDEASPLLLREHDIPVHGDIEHPVVSLDEVGRDAQIVFKRRRHPGSACVVVSGHAIGDRDSHPGTSLTDLNSLDNTLIPSMRPLCQRGKPILTTHGSTLFEYLTSHALSIALIEGSEKVAPGECFSVVYREE